MSLTVALAASQATLAEGDYFSLTVTVTAGAAVGKQAVVALDGPFFVDGLNGQEEDGKIEIVSVYPSAYVPSWNARPGSSEITPIDAGGAYQLSYATGRGSTPVRIRFGVGVAVGQTWTFTHVCKVRSGISGRATVWARVIDSDDPLMYGGDWAKDSVDLTFSRYARTADLATPTGLAAGSATSSSIALSWAMAGSGESGTRIYRATDSAGPFTLAATAPKGTTSWTDSRLSASTTYYYKVAAFSPFSEGTASASVSLATSADASSVTGSPGAITATAYGHYAILVSWAAGTVAGHAKWNVKRATSSGGAFSTVGTASAATTTWTDYGCSGGTAYYYKVEPATDTVTGTESSEATATTATLPSNLSAVGGKTVDPHSVITQLQVAKRHFTFSDKDRAIVQIGGNQYYAGLKPHRSTPVLSDGGAGALTGTFTAYVVLLRSSGMTRSLPTVVSNEVTVTSKKLTVTMPLSGGYVYRDVGYDANGNEVIANDFWEVYLAESGSDNAYLVGRAPNDSATFTTSGTLTAADLNVSKCRPMELGNESAILPACGRAVYKDNRIWLTGERSFRPLDASDEITFTGGSRTVTCTGFEFTDAMYQKQIYLNGKPTGWVIWDVISQTEVEIRHPDELANNQGWPAAEAGTYSDFSVEPVAGRVYGTAYFNGEANGLPTFSPETFDPLVMLEGELDPDDGEQPNGLIATRSALFVSKPSKVFAVLGGGLPGSDASGVFSDLRVFPVSRTHGVLAPDTLCQDADGNVYCLSAQGVAMVRESGVQIVGQYIGTARLFNEVFDIEDACTAVGTWMTRDQCFVVCGLNAKGERGGRDGLIYHRLPEKISRFRLPRRVTALCAYAKDNGEQIVLFGDEGGNVGELFPRGRYSDDVDLTRDSVYAVERDIAAQITSAILRGPTRLLVPNGRGGTNVMVGPGEIKLAQFAPTIRTYPGDEAVPCTLDVMAIPRMGKIAEFAASSAEDTMDFDTQRGDGHFSMNGTRSQALQFRLTVTPPRGERAEWNGLDVVMALSGLSQVQSGG